MSPSDAAGATSRVSGIFRGVSTPRAGFTERKRKGSPQFAMRLTPEERGRLEREAGDTPLATYIKFRLFNNLPPLASFRPSRPGGRPATDTQLIAKLLAALGQSRIANNLNQLAKAVNMGTLPVSSETESELREACEAVRAMRHDLVAALGLKPGRAAHDPQG